MYLRKVKSKKTGRIYLSIVQSYRDNSSKYPKATTIKSLGINCDVQRIHRRGRYSQAVSIGLQLMIQRPSLTRSLTSSNISGAFSSTHL